MEMIFIFMGSIAWISQKLDCIKPGMNISQERQALVSSCDSPKKRRPGGRLEKQFQINGFCLVHQLQKYHLSRVTVTRSDADDAGVPARTLRELRGHLGE